jgi:succinoglycan biosynthesis protein ExoM
MHFRFDKDYGTTGGEDSKLFSSIRESGAKFISCYESITYEFVPEERANIKWLIRRVFSTGNSYTRSRISINGKQSFYISLLEFSKGFIQFIIAFLFSLIFIWSKTRCLNWFLISVSNISKPLAVLGFYHNEYKEK